MLPVSPVSTDFYGNIRSLNFDSFRAYSKGRFRNLHFIQLDPIHKSQLLVIALWNPQTIIVIIMCILWQGVFNRSNGCTSMSRDIGNGESAWRVFSLVLVFPPVALKCRVIILCIKLMQLLTIIQSFIGNGTFESRISSSNSWTC